MEILFIGKKNDENAEKASEYLKQIFPESQVILVERGTTFQNSYKHLSFDYIFSYLSPWIIPKEILNKTRIASINWHPGPPEYPGIGCTNFAIYNNEKQFGVTCHYMLPKVDTGDIISVKKFKILENDTVYTITQKCYALILNSFYEIIEKISLGESLPHSNEKWKRKPYTRKELDDLSRIDKKMDLEEINKRIKSTTYDKPWAFVEIKGKKFYYKD